MRISPPWQLKGGYPSIEPMKSHVDHCKYDLCEYPTQLALDFLTLCLAFCLTTLSHSHTLYSSLSSTIGHTTPSLLCYEPRIYKNYKFLFITPEEACVSVLNVLVDWSIVDLCMVERVSVWIIFVMLNYHHHFFSVKKIFIIVTVFFVTWFFQFFSITFVNCHYQYRCLIFVLCILFRFECDYIVHIFLSLFMVRYPCLLFIRDFSIYIVNYLSYPYIKVSKNFKILWNVLNVCCL